MRDSYSKRISLKNLAYLTSSPNNENDLVVEHSEILKIEPLCFIMSTEHSKILKIKALCFIMILKIKALCFIAQ